MKSPKSSSLPFDPEDLFGPVIHSHSRAEALEEGVMVDVTCGRQDSRISCGP